MIPHNLVGRFIFVQPKLTKFGPVGKGRWVYLSHIRPDGLLICFSMQDGGLMQHRYPQEGERSYAVVASKRDNAAAEAMIEWLNEKLADPNGTLIDPAGALEIRDLMVKTLQNSVEADVEAAREEEDAIIQARFHELGKPVAPWKPEPMPVISENTELPGEVEVACDCDRCNPPEQAIYADTILVGGVPLIHIVGTDKAAVQAKSRYIVTLLKMDYEDGKDELYRALYGG